MEDDGIFYGHLVHVTFFCYILWTFGIVLSNLVYFFLFWYFVPRKICQPCSEYINIFVCFIENCHLHMFQKYF
jgi:hypothetical protein